MRCLWVLPKPLFPIRDGARMANNALLSPMRKHFEHLDILYFDEKLSNHDLSLYLENFKPQNVFILRHYQTNNRWLKILTTLLSFLLSPRSALTASNFYSRNNVSKIKRILDSNKYDVIVFDGLHPYTCFRNLNLGNSKIIYRAHNVEHQLWSSAAERSQSKIWKTFLIWQGTAMARLEKELVDKCTKLWAISQDDLDQFSTLFSPSKGILIGAGMDFETREMRTVNKKQPIKLMFLGKLDWAPNTDGLNWFLKEIWPNLKPGRFHLNIVGGGHFQCSLQNLEDKAITFHGFVDDLASSFKQNDLGIVPIRFGSGTRIKVIECVSKGLPLISTNMGVQGSGLLTDDFISADSAEDWIQKLNNLDLSVLENQSQLAYKRLHSLYDKEVLAKLAFNSL